MLSVFYTSPFLFYILLQMEPKILFKKLDPHALVPIKKTNGAAGLDLFACETKIVESKSRTLINTGIGFSIPNGYYGRIAPRSGLSLKHCIDIGGGVVDNDYTGSVGVIFINNDDLPYLVEYGERVAQIIFEKIADPFILEELKHSELPATNRGAKGFGSTDMPVLGEKLNNC